MSAYGSNKRLTSRTENLNKRIPENPKYKHVGAIVDSGAAQRKVQSFGKDPKKAAGDEVFRRIKLSTFVTLMVEVAKDVLDNRVPGNDSDKNSVSKNTLLDDEPFSLPSVITGVGELDRKSGRFSHNAETLQNQAIKVKDSPYLLLDVRDSEAYGKCHIITAFNYPSSMLCRTCNYETKELLAFKNVPLRLIVFYDEDETIASRVASTMIQRGYNNVFMLTGGLRLAASKFPEGLITGSLPESCRPKSLTPKRSLTIALPAIPNTIQPRKLQESFTEDNVNVLQAQVDTVSIRAGSQSRGSLRTSSINSAQPSLSSRATAMTAGTTRTRCTSSRPQHWR